MCLRIGFSLQKQNPGWFEREFLSVLEKCCFFFLGGLEQMEGWGGLAKGNQEETPPSLGSQSNVTKDIAKKAHSSS